MLATKISFINEMANLCERMNADVNEVRRGIGHDQPDWLRSSCFPASASAAVLLSRRIFGRFWRRWPGRHVALLRWIMDAECRRGQRVRKRQVLFAERIERHFYGGKLGRAKRLAVWGLSFKPRTDDIREAPALVLIDSLLAAGARVRVHDSEAMDNVRAIYGDKLVYCDRPYGAVEGADGLAIVTEWQEFRNPDFEVMKRLLTTPVIFDGRNIYDEKAMAAHGFTYYAIGRGRRG